MTKENQEVGRLGLTADRATRASTEPASGLGPDGRVSTDAAPTMPLWLDRRRIQFVVHFDNGPLILEAPRVLTPEEIVDLDQYFSLIATGFHRRASAIEARSGQTEGLDPKGESAAPEGGDAQ